ncbi:MAG: hypothetical protein ACRC6Z_07665 [Cetobacterium sp.]
MKKNKNIYLKSLLETFVYCGFIYLFFFYFSHFKLDFLNLNPHPLLLIIAIVSLKYGIYSGMTAAFIALSTYYLVYYQVGNDPIVFFYSSHYYKYIIIYFLIGLLLGKISDNNKNKIEELKIENKDIDVSYKEQIKENINLKKVSEEFEYQIIGSKDSIITLHHIIDSFKHLKKEEIYVEAVNLIKHFLKCEFISVHLYDKENLNIEIESGEKLDECIISKKNQEERVENIKIEKKALELVEKIEDKMVFHYIAPILIQNKVIGFINVQTTEENNHGKFMFQLFKIIVNWTNHFLEMNFLKNKSYEV